MTYDVARAEPTTAMRIGLNLLPAVPGIGGTWNYIAGLMSALAERDGENEYVAFVTKASAPLVPDRPNFRRVEVSLRASSRPLRVAFENTVFRFVIAAQHLDCMHHLFGTLPFAGRIPTVVSVQDLMVFTRPKDFEPIKRVYLRVMRRRAAFRASVLAPMSQSTADHLTRQFGVAGERMQVVPAAIGPEFTARRVDETAAFRARLALPDAFWLYVSGAYPHKNHGRLIAAIAERARREPGGWPLVIRGEPTEELRALIAKGGVTDRVTFLPRLPDGDMPLLYSAATALISPSLFEGGGLPVMEAMACGCPVVASDIPTTREFAASAALTFDPSSVGAIVDAMNECERSPALRARLRDAGLVGAAKLGSSVLAAACLEAYRRAVNGSRPPT